MDINTLAASLTSEHLYPVLGLALVAGGIPALLGSIYLSLHGYIDMAVLFALFFVTSLAWDMAWYGLGTFLRSHHPAWIVKRLGKVRELEKAYVDKNMLKIIFASRFIYGTNSAVSILSGIKRVPFAKFLLVSISTLFIWFFAMLLIGYSINASLPEFQNTLENILIGASVFWIAVIAVFGLLKKYLWAKLVGAAPDEEKKADRRPPRMVTTPIGHGPWQRIEPQR